VVGRCPGGRGLGRWGLSPWAGGEKEGYGLFTAFG